MGGRRIQSIQWPGIWGIVVDTIPVTVLIQTKNEALGILECLDTLRDFGEVIVVDSASTDDTAQLASSWGARVINFEWNGRYPQKKQWQLQAIETKHEWVLMLDADEYPTEDLKREIRAVISGTTDFVAFDIPIAYYFSGRELRHGHRVIKRSLLLRGKNRFEDHDLLGLPGMGEVEAHYQPIAAGKAGRLSSLLVHDDRDPVRTWFERHNRYSDWEAHIRRDGSVREAVRESKSRQGRLFDKVPFKPFLFFGYSYVFRKGFLDGRAGLDYALALSFYYWMIDVKYRELIRSKDKSTVNA